MKFLLLAEKANKKIIKFLSSIGEVSWTSDYINEHTSKEYDWIISFGYRHIIKRNILNISKNKIINLHISYLPYNRGASPNYWSFKEKTPKGVTIHLIDEGIDTGPILIQKKCSFNDNDTLKTSYEKLIKNIEILFIENFEKIITGKIKPVPQKGKGTFHKKKDLLEKIDYNTKINEI